MRLFVGLPVPAPLTPLVDEAGELFRARPVPSGRFHITLQFLDEQEDVQGIRQALRQALADAPAPSVRVKGLGAFPETYRARILWAGIKEDQPGSLAALAGRVQEAMRPWAEPDTRAFEPHVTIGRLKTPRDVGEWTEKYADDTWYEGALERAVLYQSETGPTGRVYRKADSWALRPA